MRETTQPAPIHDELAVEDANERFYRALESCRLEDMETIWLHEDWVKCVHPGWDLITGWEKVRESWERIFENTDGMRVAATDLAIKVEGDFAWVSCTENLALFLDNSLAPVSATTAATNLFCRVGEQWLMVHHHASQTAGATPINESDTIQ
jgi:ketosteroid isomerase-like protein